MNRLVNPLVVVALAVVVAGCASPAPSTGATSLPSPSIAPSTTPAPVALHLVVLGDSIAIPRMGCGECEGFDQQYAALLEARTGRPVELRNEARPNARIEDLQAVLDSEAAVQAEVAGADIVVVSIGYNNTPPWAPDLPCHTPAPATDADLWPGILAMTPSCIEAGVALFAQKLDAVYGQIEELSAGRTQLRISLGVFNNLKDNPGGDGTLLSVDPAVMTAAYPIYESAIPAWNKADCAAATAHGFTCADLDHAFNGHDGSASLKVFVNPADFVHPNVAGQTRIYELLKFVDVGPVVGRAR